MKMVAFCLAAAVLLISTEVSGQQPEGRGWTHVPPPAASTRPRLIPIATGNGQVIYVEPTVLQASGSIPIGSSANSTVTAGSSVVYPAPYYQGKTYRPIIALRPMPSGYRIGRGIIGQPKVYVPGQPLRNFLRYLTP